MFILASVHDYRSLSQWTQESNRKMGFQVRGICRYGTRRRAGGLDRIPTTARFDRSKSTTSTHQTTSTTIVAGSLAPSTALKTPRSTPQSLTIHHQPAIKIVLFCLSSGTRIRIDCNRLRSSEPANATRRRICEPLVHKLAPLGGMCDVRCSKLTEHLSERETISFRSTVHGTFVRVQHGFEPFHGDNRAGCAIPSHHRTLKSVLFGFQHLFEDASDLIDRQLLAPNVLLFVIGLGCSLDRDVCELGWE